MSDLELIASTAFGLESTVRYELELLGYAGRIVGPGKVLFAGGPLAICRANLWLRAADRVLIRIALFRATDFDGLFETTRAIDWSRWITPDGCFPVSGRSIKSQLSSVPAIQRSVKKAIVLALEERLGVSTLPETGATFPIEVALLEDEVTLTLDTTGPSLHKRGYRSRGGRAPLKETLAAALVRLSFWDGRRPLLDPFCGTGTIPIEAAMIGRDIAPGLRRSFPCEEWPLVRPEHFREAREEARSRARPSLPVRLIGTDIDARVLEFARESAERAGVASDIHFQQLPFHETRSHRQYGCVITNPPYGERLGEMRELRPLYESMPEVLQRLETWSHFILTAYPDFERVVERRADRRRKLYNGRIECTYYQFHGPKPPLQDESARQDTPARTEAEESVAETAGEEENGGVRGRRTARRAPVFGGLPAGAAEQARLFETRLSKRARHLRRWPTKQGISCFRIYERDVPEIPLTVDRYEDHLHIVEYEQNHERDRGEHAAWLDLMVATASKVLDVPVTRAFLKRRRRQRGREQHQRVADRRYELVVREGGLRFWVNLSDYTDTGLFLDHRITRDRVRGEAAGTRFLNLFAYTGAFTVYAADGGARATTTVDLSPVYQAWSRRNMELNGFEGDEHEFVADDAMTYLRRLPRQDLFDLAVLDPPTFSNSKRTGQVWDVQRHHVDLLTELLLRMRRGGVIYFSSNYRRLKLREAEIEASEVRDITAQTVPPDFRNRRVHRCWRIVR